ncbi:polysaccharide deacetylase family protein [Streptomyces sp. NPDC001508]|uniref:polysaccharide deacetylase family protein n=1 Tax=Streptomyces sp. NPDC001508 TaxID=3154656 RepID=UPI0033223908
MAGRALRRRAVTLMTGTVLAAVACTVGPAAGVASQGPYGTPADGSRPPPVDCRATPCVALTFDDGPTGYTPAVLRALERQHAVATFFLIGPHALHHRADVLREYRDGDAIGDHTVTHPHLTLLPPARIRHELESAARQIASVTGHRPTIYRPPFGAWNAKVRAAAGGTGLSVVMWNVDPRDWKHHDPRLIERRVLAGVRPGAIVVLHDRYASTPQAVPYLLRALKARGYAPVTVPQLFATSGGMRSGVVYHHGP